MLFFLSVLLATILVTLFTERFIKPKSTVFSVKTLALHSIIITIIFLALTLFVQRPIFSALTVMIFFIIVVAVNNTKFIALKESLVFSDFAMFAQAFKHPRLYFGFLGLVPVIITTVIIVGLIITVLKLEPAMPFTWQRILSTFIAIALALFVSHKIALSFKLSTNIEDDNASFGLVNTLYSYLIHSRTSEHQKQLKSTLKTAPFSLSDNPPPSIFDDLYSADNKPNITVIQSESFFDARRLHPSIKTSV